MHGPNLNLLGEREPEIYGTETLAEIDLAIEGEAAHLGLAVESFQSNSEGALIDRIHAVSRRAEILILNAAGYTHTSVAIADAVAAVRHRMPAIEVHLSIPGAREAFRRTSLLEGVVAGRIEGFGSLSYLLALRAASTLLGRRGRL